MQLFFKKIGLLLLLFMASIVILYFYGDYKKPANPIKGTTTTTTTLFVGDSHIQKAINDSMLENSQNIALSAEPIKYSYFKIQQVLAEKNTINKIYLGFSYHSISSTADDIVSGKVKNLDNSHVYFSYLPWEEKINLVEEHRSMLFSYTQKIFHQAVRNLDKSSIKFFYSDYWGGYVNEFGQTSVELSKANKRINFYFNQQGRGMDFSSTNILYLNKIISLCKEKQVALVLVNTPLHSSYLRAVPKKFKSRYHTIIQQSGLPYIDFSEYQFSDSMFMPDGDHVSARGAAVVTNMIKEMQSKSTH